tara:strand:- start:274 stop:612 length:339 start_codon:yes stop_codon:yes gene_type:complete
MQTVIKATIVFILSLTFKMYGQQTYDLNKKLTDYLTIQNERIGFNGVVLIANNKDVLYQKAIGFTSFENKIPLAIDSKFKIASISKSFTGMLIAMAIEEGNLMLNDPIKQIF